ncbi:pseudouridine synthase [Thermaerobacter marianensis DSM 12885]|uniref:RNA pseudouridylate synthase n=1 Tax=Thermaerobacter marianensis (strain ATCC 700841 / DSM 12885 / JCM 10246 / 7p75a) TaxID=644966 RepID=E6SJF1_THEM7|nr:RluA family pseudouridine synthase [Thermaerobacter marianensis]ADU52106.1 pseudouridine synthase [Thermaerobacter marianensis DSM 12885]
MPRLRYVVTPADEGQKLHRLARRWLRDVPLSAVFRLLRQGRITVNGRRAPRDAVLRAGDVIEAELERVEGPGPDPSGLRPGAAGRPGPRPAAPHPPGPRPAAPQPPGLRPAAPHPPAPHVPGPRVPELDPVIVYEDDHVLVVNKPAGMLTHGDGHAEWTLLAWVRDQLARRGTLPAGALFQPSPAHRLDRNTSGLVAFGKTRHGAARLAEALRSGQAIKEYLAVVRGRPPEGLLQHRLWRDRDHRVSRVIGQDGEAPTAATTSRDIRASSGAGRTLPARPAADEPGPGAAGAPPAATGDLRRTGAAAPGAAREARHAALRLAVLAVGHGFSLCRIHLLTGRTHQIRAQLAATGHPLAGDRKYGGPKVPGLQRPALHCYRLVLPGGVDVVAPLPPDLTGLCRRLGLALPGIRGEG